MKISLLTTTGARPQAFALCERWMNKQTHPWDEWLVCDDGEKPTPTHLSQTVIRPQPYWELGQNTQARNLLMGLEACTGDVIFIIEDDDYYSPGYIKTYIEEFEKGFSIVGEAQAFYYHLMTSRYRRLRNYTYATLCQTAFTNGTAKKIFVDTVQKNYAQIDYKFWKASQKRNLSCQIFPRSDLVVGIKGMPGRPGIGIGHDSEKAKEWQTDLTPLMKLKELIGKDVEHYMRIIAPGLKRNHDMMMRKNPPRGG